MLVAGFFAFAPDTGYTQTPLMDGQTMLGRSVPFLAQIDPATARNSWQVDTLTNSQNRDIPYGGGSNLLGTVGGLRPWLGPVRP